MNDIKKFNLIDMNVYVCRIQNVDNQKITNEIKNNSTDISQKYLDGYLQNHNHTYYEDKKYPNTEECNKLKSLISIKVNQVLKKPMKMESIWTLTLEQGQSVSYHSHKSNAHLHPIEYYSIAYYPTVPKGSAKLIFHTTAYGVIDANSSIEPEESMLLIFNSFIPHMTDRHLPQDPRIVVSANFAPINRNTKIVPDWSAYDV